MPLTGQAKTAYQREYMKHKREGLTKIQLDQVKEKYPRLRIDMLHYSDCAVYNEPAYPNGPCDCGAVGLRWWAHLYRLSCMRYARLRSIIVYYLRMLIAFKD